jgi:hypothetical protein
MIRRLGAVALCLLMANSVTTQSARAAGAWNVTTSTGKVNAGFVTQSLSTAVLYLENNVGFKPLGLEDAGVVLDMLGFGGGYSQEVTWDPAGQNLSVDCANELTDVWTFCNKAEGWAVIPDGLRAELNLSTYASSVGTLNVAPGVHSIKYDIAAAAIGLALTVLGTGVKPHLVAELAYTLFPDASGMLDAIKRNDGVAEGWELLALANQAAKVIIKNAVEWGLDAAATQISPFVLEVKLCLKLAQVDTALGHLVVALLADEPGTTVTVSSGGAEALSAPANVAGRVTEASCPDGSDTLCDTYDLTWTHVGGGTGFRIYSAPRTECLVGESCASSSGCVLSERALQGSVAASARSYTATLGASSPFSCWWVAAYDDKGESTAVEAEFACAESCGDAGGPSVTLTPKLETSGWQTYQGDGYVIDYPGAALYEKIPDSQTYGLYSGGISYYTVGSDTNPQAVYLAEHITFPSYMNASSFDYTTFLKEMLSLYSMSSSNLAITQHDITVDGKSGLYFSMEGGGSAAESEVVAVGNDLYLVMAAHQTSDTTLDSQRFFQSFHLR